MRPDQFPGRQVQAECPGAQAAAALAHLPWARSQDGKRRGLGPSPRSVTVISEPSFRICQMKPRGARPFPALDSGSSLAPQWQGLPDNAGDTGSVLGLGRSHKPWINSAHVPRLLSLRSRVQGRQLPSPPPTAAAVLVPRVHAPLEEKSQHPGSHAPWRRGALSPSPTACHTKGPSTALSK